MKSVYLGFAALIVAVAPALADSNVLCVQQELAARGFNPGPPDGLLGARTLSAAQAAGVGPLTTANAASVCRSLRPAAQVYSPPNAIILGQQPAFVRRLETQEPTFSSSIRPTACPAYVINPDDPCF